MQAEQLTRLRWLYSWAVIPPDKDPASTARAMPSKLNRLKTGSVLGFCVVGQAATLRTRELSRNLVSPLGVEPRTNRLRVGDWCVRPRPLCGIPQEIGVNHVHCVNGFPQSPARRVSGRVSDKHGRSQQRPASLLHAVRNLFWGRREAVGNNTGDTAILHDAAGTQVAKFTVSG